MSERAPSSSPERRPESAPTSSTNYTVESTPPGSSREDRRAVARRLATHAAAGGHGSHSSDHGAGGILNSEPVKVGKGLFGFFFDLLWQGIKSLPSQWTGGGGGGGGKKSGGHGGGHGDSHGGGGHH